MARPRTIDRENVLDCVERLVHREGVAALTLEAVAREAGITKGGLQYCFGSKDDLMTALIDRWLAAFDASVARQIGPDADVIDRARAYVLTISQIDDTTQARMAGMLVTLLQSPKYLQKIRAWYAGWFNGSDPDSRDARQARIAIFAAEGAFFLRSLGFMEMDQEWWKTTFADFQRLILSDPCTP
ncbi:TetR/AcrR family transcriptional regulator [Komagataeibacter sp. FXV3]|uniref:TetR/AcrR family transcriptional regulator n=1 Tax=Komagataeibacter sp. FXV3 TaxID=2608998 RepID=UPI00187B31D1|nr:TetR/AcrR family transcriptional regulator [Komagataeibacter sp. FXV3]MBE7729787.1 TetR/AcrR family transcriptional regulator [Komagataeibacter sp. FXV3]